MKITKFGHSCLLVEERGKRLLIDPGNVVFMDGSVRPEQFTGIDAVLLTHEHHDHTFVDALKVIVERNSPSVITNPAVGKILDAVGIDWSGKGSSMVTPVQCPHGLLPEPLPAPDNAGFLIAGRLFHPGDCITAAVTTDILALPVIAPWCSLRESLAYARKMQPKVIIPSTTVSSGIRTSSTASSAAPGLARRFTQRSERRSRCSHRSYSSRVSFTAPSILSFSCLENLPSSLFPSARPFAYPSSLPAA